jgi:hypothetical protein
VEEDEDGDDDNNDNIYGNDDNDTIDEEDLYSEAAGTAVLKLLYCQHPD